MVRRSHASNFVPNSAEVELGSHASVRNTFRKKGIEETMDRLGELKNKYQPVLTAISQSGVKLDHLHVQDNKLFMQGAAPNQDIKNAVWNKIKEVDPAYSDLMCDLRIDASLPAPAPAQSTTAPNGKTETYVVKAGDSLWKIAQQFYGKGNLFPKIIAANPDKLKDEKSVIHPGDQLSIPV
jgi:nucleoid-associated protein YgaU